MLFLIVTNIVLLKPLLVEKQKKKLLKLGKKITTLKTQDKLVNFGAIMIVKRLECVLDKDMKKRFVAILNSTMEKLNYKPSDYHIVESVFKKKIRQKYNFKHCFVVFVLL